MTLSGRQQELVNILRSNSGRMSYVDLAAQMYPEDRYPRAWRYSSNGGPPGCYMALSTMIRKLGLNVYCPDGGKCRAEISLPARFLNQEQSDDPTGNH